MTTMLLITLAAGVVLGILVGVPVGRFLERVRPKRRADQQDDE